MPYDFKLQDILGSNLLTDGGRITETWSPVATSRAAARPPLESSSGWEDSSSNGELLDSDWSEETEDD